MSRERKRLLRAYDRLGEREREMLLAFAEFLDARSRPMEEAPLPSPVAIPRPPEETVIGAIKRLTATYPMVDKAKILHETSALVSQHMLQGRQAVTVIDELEVVFRRHYEAVVAMQDGDRQ